MNGLPISLYLPDTSLWYVILYLSRSFANSRYEPITPIDPVIDILSAKILSVAEAIQYAPDVPISVINEIDVLFNSFIAVAMLLDAIADPPGEFISNKIALIFGFSFAFFIASMVSDAIVSFCPIKLPVCKKEIEARKGY